MWYRRCALAFQAREDRSVTGHPLLHFIRLFKMNNNLMLDLDVATAIMNYVFKGLHPGSFGEACLIGDYDIAYSKAHYKLKSTEYDNQDIIKNMIEVCSKIPIGIRSSRVVIDNWCKHDGLERCSPNELIYVKLAWDSQIWGDFDTRLKIYSLTNNIRRQEAIPK
jgi:hypothetical protein